MSDKLTAALTALEKARATALDVAITERVYRAAAALDDAGQVQRGIDRARRMIQPRKAKTDKTGKK